MCIRDRLPPPRLRTTAATVTRCRRLHAALLVMPVTVPRRRRPACAASVTNRVDTMGSLSLSGIDNAAAAGAAAAGAGVGADAEAAGADAMGVIDGEAAADAVAAAVMAAMSESRAASA